MADLLTNKEKINKVKELLKSLDGILVTDAIDIAGTVCAFLINKCSKERQEIRLQEAIAGIREVLRNRV